MVLKVLKVTQSEPTNIFSESHYATQTCKILSFAKLMFQKVSISKIMQTIQDLLQSRGHPWHLLHIRSHIDNHRVDCLIMTIIASLPLLGQARILHQQFCFSSQNLHKLLPGLPLLSCKHLI